MKKTLFVIILWNLLLVGCDAKEIQSQTYITSLGIDYIDDEFVVYTQALNFANIAKQEGASSLQEAAPIFIGEAKAKSIHSALSKLEQESALPFYFGHVNTILLSEKVINNKLGSVVEFIGQDPFLRYNMWIFGTKENVKDLLLGESFFNFPSIYTIIHNPKILTKNNLLLPIEEYNRFISSYHQPVGSFIIPSVTLIDDTFSEDNKKKKIAAITGGFAISQQQFKGWIAKENLVGIKWVTKESENIPLTLANEKVSLIIHDPMFHVEVLTGAIPSYRLLVKVNAQLSQNEGDMSYSQIEKEVEKKIRNEIAKTIEQSEAIQADLLNISETAYRYHFKEWELQAINTISKDSIKKIDVDVNIIKAIHYKH